MNEIGHFINGASVAGQGHQLLINPATEVVSGQVAFAGADEAEQAVQAAHQAFPAWANTTPLQRARLFFKLKALLERDTDLLAQMVTREHGKALDDARASIKRAIECVEFACGAPYLLKGSYSDNAGPDIDCYTLRQSVGVCVGISPFNFPVMIPAWLMVPAVACGNTVVLKPSEQAPSAPLRFAELFAEAGFPPGVVNVLNGDKTAVEALIGHPKVNAVSAVASTQTARAIYQKAIAADKRCQTFGGAKNHAVVMPDADLAEAADAIVAAAYGSAGERCMAISAVVTVGDKTADLLIEQMQQRLAQLKIGPGDSKNIDMGPLVSQTHLQRVKDYVALGQKEGAVLAVDGAQATLPDKGYFMGPYLFDRVTQKMRIYREEIFGPVLVVLRAQNFEEALTLVNEHPYGNGTALFTRDGRSARRFSREVQAGMVGINVAIPVPVNYHSFGGWKSSRFGDVFMHAEQSIQFYTQLKTVTSRWPKQESEALSYHMPTNSN